MKPTTRGSSAARAGSAPASAMAPLVLRKLRRSICFMSFLFLFRKWLLVPERGDHRGARRAPAGDAALGDDHLDGGALELGEVAVGRVLDQQALITAVVRLAQRGLHAHLGGDTGEQQVGDAAQAQDVAERGGVEGAFAGLVDDDLAWARRELGH